jgi:hypothetical protein
LYPEKLKNRTQAPMLSGVRVRFFCRIRRDAKMGIGGKNLKG